MADELLRLYAERKAHPGIALPAANDDYRAFEATFPFDETVDQSHAIDDVGRDLEADRPMDRLVCGDVGFGKTEVAIRAAFRVAMAGKQVALLCPTTILAQQHYRVLETRLADYPIHVRALSRFQSHGEQQETLAFLKDGRCDVVVGTHRLLSKDVHFKDLGLLVVDEEQRFGVAHKERIKQLRAQVDVLTLTATPIPRTLQMAVSGLRDLSLITTAPVDRRAVRTIVTRFDDQVIREAVQRELARGGQVLLRLQPHRRALREGAAPGQELVPEARVVVGHGQMPRAREACREEGTSRGRSSGSMLDFVDGRYDVLVVDGHRRERPRHPPRQHHHHRPRRPLRSRAALPAARPRGPVSKERALLLPRRPATQRDDRRGAGAHRGARASHRARQRLPDRVARPRAARARAICSVASSRATSRRGVRPVLPHARRGRARDARRDGRARRRPGDVVRRRPRCCPSRLRRRDRRASVALQAPRERRRRGARRTRSPRRWRTASVRPRRTRAASSSLMSLKTELRRLKVLGCEASSRTVTLHLREDTPLDPKKVTDLGEEAREARTGSPPTCACHAASTASATGWRTPRRSSPTSPGVSRRGGDGPSGRAARTREGVFCREQCRLLARGLSPSLPSMG